MKNKIVVAIIFIVTGIFVGNSLYKKIDLSIIETFKENNNYYLLSIGVYDSKEEMQKETRDINPKIYEEKDNKYYVYVAITSTERNREKIKKIYEDEGINVKIKKVNIKDNEFINNITQFDILIENASNKDEVLAIEEVILSSYSKKILGN